MFIVNQDRNTTINMENVKEISLHGETNLCRRYRNW